MVEYVPVGFALLVLRLILAQIFLLHGVRKIARKEADGTPKYVLLGWIEAAAAILMLLGWFWWLAAGTFIVIMLGAIFAKLFVWKGQEYAGNIEYDVLILAASLVVLSEGPGIMAL